MHVRPRVAARRAPPRHRPLSVVAVAALALLSAVAVAVPAPAHAADLRHRQYPLAGLDVIHEFDGTSATGGERPEGPLALTTGGDVFGTTTYVDDLPGGRGGLYQVRPHGRTALVTPLTERPSALMAATAAGETGLFGTRIRQPYVSQPGGCGELLRLPGARAATTLHRFSSDDPAGCSPQPVLTEAPDGSVYGATQYGSTYGAGAIWRAAPEGRLEVVAASMPLDAGGPDTSFRLALAADGNLYVPTRQGLMRVAPAGGTATVATFDHDAIGYQPASALVTGADGALYGTLAAGGPGQGGSVYRFDPATAAVTLVHAFDRRGPGAPGALTAGADGLLYGLARAGGRDHVGGIYRVAPDGSGYASLLPFVAAEDGYSDGGPLLALPDGRLMGTRTDGGPGRHGTVYLLTPVAPGR